MSKLSFLWALMVGGSFPRNLRVFESQGFCLAILNIWINVSDEREEMPAKEIVKGRQIGGFGEINSWFWVRRKAS